jgi:His-Xaa-Ser system radical SAM maturase HxsB
MRFEEIEAYLPKAGYRLLPFRFSRLTRDPASVLITNLAGRWAFVTRMVLESLVAGELDPRDPVYSDLESAGFLQSLGSTSTLAPLLAQIRTKRAFLFEGPALHIFVVTLRCHHSCGYCQVSRKAESSAKFDMNVDQLDAAVRLLFQWPSPSLTIEFQGGEPLLAFDRIRELTEKIVRENEAHKKELSFVVASTLHDLDDEKLRFFAEFDFKLSTSLDGPAFLHNANRPIPTRDSYERTLAGISHARQVLGDNRVSALTTITRKSLEFPEQIVDEYVKQGFHSIFLRPLSPYGFARKGVARLGYEAADFSGFYTRAFERIIQHNLAGYELEEAYASLALGQMLTSFANGYVDIRSPTGALFGAVVYDFDGGVYPSDEARMLAAMGDPTFRLGEITDSPEKLMSSPAMTRILNGGVAESIPQCADCAYLPFCGADPVDSYARQGDEIGHRPSSEFCARQMQFLEFIFDRWQHADAPERNVMSKWARPKPAEMEPV